MSIGYLKFWSRYYIYSLHSFLSPLNLFSHGRCLPFCLVEETELIGVRLSAKLVDLDWAVC